ncbi:hypothetical protein WJX74_002564 [Apatococcus lobatus]|uniref:DUF6816 domain-containing protein n=1 Tax=Apatococcus lobatus TaxID=904363 RepID=A0AAW1S1W5_9CHLO
MLRSQQTHSAARRDVLNWGGASLAASLWLQSLPAQASKLPPVFDRAWESIGGGPADLFFPEDFMGMWEVSSTLTKSVQRALDQDLNREQHYPAAFRRNKGGKVIIDRAFNTAKLISMYNPDAGSMDRISWNPDDPNLLKIFLPGGSNVLARVVRRSEDRKGADRLDTSEFFQQIFEKPDSPEPRVKASQCFTKYKWRSEASSQGGPAIVATQVVSDYLTAYDGEGLSIRAQNRPVTIYTYKMAFRRIKDGQGLSI